MKHYLRLLSSSALIAALSFGTGLNCIPAGATGAADPDQWNISALIDRSEPCFGVSVGNGGIGILPSNVPSGCKFGRQDDIFLYIMTPCEDYC